jgi:hypothetical protein
LLQLIEPRFGRLFRFAKNLVWRNAQQHDHHGGGGNNGWQKRYHARVLPGLIEKPSFGLNANLSNQFILGSACKRVAVRVITGASKAGQIQGNAGR